MKNLYRIRIELGENIYSGDYYISAGDPIAAIKQAYMKFNKQTRNINTACGHPPMVIHSLLLIEEGWA